MYIAYYQLLYVPVLNKYFFSIWKYKFLGTSLYMTRHDEYLWR